LKIGGGPGGQHAVLPRTSKVILTPNKIKNTPSRRESGQVTVNDIDPASSNISQYAISEKKGSHHRPNGFRHSIAAGMVEMSFKLLDASGGRAGMDDFRRGSINSNARNN
jgi:hypothetical protein